jgi:hypothetical protein
MPVHLAAQASTMIDIGMLIAMGQPHANGNLIPNYIQEGSVVFSNPKGRAQWMTLAVCGAFYNPVKATCGEWWTYCYGYSDPEVTPSPFSVAMENTVPLNAQATYADGSVDTFTTSSSWSSSNTSVATVGASTGVVTPVSAGSVGIGAQFPSLVVYTGELCSTGCPIPCPTGNLGAGASGTVGDATPVISSISPDYWPAGTTTTGTINGQYFGTNPSVSLSDTTIAFSYTPVSDGQVNFSATVPQYDSNAVTLTVTSNGYNGSGFVPLPNGGSQASSSAGEQNYSVQIKTQTNSNNFVFVGTSDSTVTGYNTQLAVGLPNGGSYSWSSSPEAVTISPNNSTSAYLVTFTGSTASASVGSTTEAVKYYFPPTNTTFTKDTRAITLRQFSALTTPSTQSGCPDWPGAPTITSGGYLTELTYYILTTPGAQQVQSGFSGMSVSETVTQTYVSPSNYKVTLNTGESGATGAKSQVFDCQGIPSPPNPPLPSNLVICATQTLSVGGIKVRTNTLKFTNTGVSIVSSCP